MTIVYPVTLFTQDGCADSARARACLTLAGVPFIERNVSHDDAAAGALAATGLFATPVVVADGRPRLAAPRQVLPQALGFACRCPDRTADQPTRR